ncbi:MAG: cupin domain-containing protein [Vicinamibacterales bacterium]
MFGLAHIISPLTIDEFLVTYSGKRAVHVPGPSEKFEHLFGWNDVNTFLNGCRPSFEGVKLVHDTKSLPQTELARMSHWLSKGATLVINHVHHIDPITERFADIFAKEMNAAVNINAYISFPTHQGFDCHYDTHDVWIIQTAGAKEWKVFEPTRKFPLDRDPAEDKSRQTKPTEGEYLSCTLTPGDMLYIPRGHWHYALSSDPCIHLTVSHDNRSGIDFLNWLLNDWRDREEFLREDFPVALVNDLGGDRPSALLDAHLARFTSYMAELVQRDGLKEQLLHWAQVENRTRPTFQLPELAQLDREPIGQDVLFEAAPAQKLVPHVDANGQIQLIARGRVVLLSNVPRAIVDALLQGHPFSGASLLTAAPQAAWSQVQRMLTDLFVAGLIVLVKPED